MATNANNLTLYKLQPLNLVDTKIKRGYNVYIELKVVGTNMKKTEIIKFRVSKEDKDCLYRLAKERGMSVSEYILSKTLKKEIESIGIKKLRGFQELVNELIREDCTEEITERERQEYQEYMREYLPRVIKAVEEELSRYTVARIRKASIKYEKNLYKLREFQSIVEVAGNSIYELSFRDETNTYGHRTYINDIMEVINYIEDRGKKYL